MSKGCWHVKPSEIQRMLEAVKKAGLHVTAIEMTQDGIKVKVSETADANRDAKPEPGEWD